MRRVFTIFFLCGLALSSAGALAQNKGKAQDLEKAIHDYLLSHPEVIIEALERYEAHQRNAQKEAAKAALNLHRDILFKHPMTPVSGGKDADVTIVEFFDYQCGFCKRVLSTVVSVIENDPKIRVVWKEFPILGPTSEFAARAAMAAERQGKYLQFHTNVMGARGQLTPQKVLRIAEKIGLDVERLKKDMAAPEITKYLADTAQLAQALGITGTPGFVIGDKIVGGAIDKAKMQELIAAMRNRS